MTAADDNIKSFTVTTSNQCYDSFSFSTWYGGFKCQATSLPNSMKLYFYRSSTSDITQTTNYVDGGMMITSTNTWTSLQRNGNNRYGAIVVTSPTGVASTAAF